MYLDQITNDELADVGGVMREIEAARLHLAARKAELAELARRAKGASK